MHEWIQAHLPEGGFIAAGFMLLKWLLGREIKRMDQRAEDQEKRLRDIEHSRVTRADMDELRMSLMASMNLVHADLTRSMNSMQADVRLLTEHLLDRKDK